MGTGANILMIALLAVIYGAVILVGGLFWLLSWQGHNTRLRGVGNVTVLLGLCADFVLLNANRLFNWVSWLETSIP